MKKNFLIVTVLALLVFCACQHNKLNHNVVDINAEISKIKAVLDQYVIANEEQNFSLLESIWAPYDKIVLLGTDSDEKFMGWKEIEKAIKRQFEAFTDTYIVVSEQNIRINSTGNTAWFSEIMNYNFIYNNEAMRFSGVRFTGVLEKIEGRWLIVQGHVSIPAEAQMKEVF